MRTLVAYCIIFAVALLLSACLLVADTQFSPYSTADDQDLVGGHRYHR